ncbi:MAG TPA: type II toxin-antitoxin system VapC family toxin [Flavobacteriales bacterium]|nr:type II toxin-antitoxin system VapC family toxin [Flavobacteriales bacterium]
MSILLDTHVLLWFQALDSRLRPALREQIEESPEDHYVSHASLWEIAVKSSLGKLSLGRDLRDTFKLIAEAGFVLMPLKEEHFLKVATLPFHHRDPFDRMLIAQAQEEGMQLMTADRHFEQYGVSLIRA